MIYDQSSYHCNVPTVAQSKPGRLATGILFIMVAVSRGHPNIIYVTFPAGLLTSTTNRE